MSSLNFILNGPTNGSSPNGPSQNEHLTDDFIDGDTSFSSSSSASHHPSPPHATPAYSPAPSVPSSSPAPNNQSSVITNLANQVAVTFGLPSSDLSNYQIFVQMGAGLPYGQLAQNAMLMAAILRLTNTITTTTDALNAQAIVINNLQARLEASFEVTIAQRTELSYIIKKLLVLDGLANAGTYCSIYIAVQGYAIANAAALKLPEGLSAENGRKYLSVIKRLGSSQRQQSEREILSTISPIAKPLDAAAAQMVLKHSKPGATPTTNFGHIAVTALLRYVAFNTPQLTAEYESRKGAPFDTEDGSASEHDEEPAEGSRKRKRPARKGKAKAVVKAPKPPSFWQLTDFVINKFKPTWGSNIGSSPDWHNFFKKIIEEDRIRWPVTVVESQSTHFTQAENAPQPASAPCGPGHTGNPVLAAPTNPLAALLPMANQFGESGPSHQSGSGGAFGNPAHMWHGGAGNTSSHPFF